MNKRSNWTLITSFLFLLLAFFVFVDTYGLFELNTEVPVAGNLAKWQILVNSQDIMGETKTFLIPTVNWETSPNVLPGKAAPGLSASFDIIIDPSTTEVAIEYELGLDFIEITNEQVYLTGVKNKSGVTILPNEDDKYVGQILLPAVLNNEQETLTVSFIWENDEDNNDIDSSFVGVKDAFLNIPITLKLSQYLG